MTTIDAVATVVEKRSDDDTKGFVGDSEKATVIGGELLIEPNRDAAHDTLTSRMNGDSSSRKTRLDRLARLDEQIFSLPPVYLTRERFKTLQKWEGYVIEVRDDTFLARLVPVVGDGHDQEAEIFFEEIEAEDRVLIEPGAVFYWSIGYLDRPSGRMRASIIRPRRLPAWSASDLKDARSKAAALRSLLETEQSI